MTGLTTLRAVKQVLMRGAFAAGLIALLGVQGTGVAAQAEALYSIVIHFQYPDGFEFDYVLARGVSSRDLGAALAECGRSHRNGSFVQYHCSAVPE